MKNWEEAEMNVSCIVQQIVDEFLQAKDSSDKPDENTQARALERCSTLETWIGKTHRNTYTAVRNDNLVRTYRSALENWSKIGGRAIEIPSQVLGPIMVAQGYICAAYQNLSIAIQQFETRLDGIKAIADPKKANSELRTLELSIKIEANSILQRLNRRQRDIKSAFRDLRPVKKHSSKGKK